MIKKPTIGLFGTCANSTWRNSLIKLYDYDQIQYFNPQVSDWKPENAVIEAKHLAEDEIILFPILSESFGLGSLAETGYSILNAISLNSRRQFVIFIEPDVDEKLYKQNPEMAKISKNTRAIIQEHLSKLNYDNVFIIDDLRNMYELSTKLYHLEYEKMVLREIFTKH